MRIQAISIEVAAAGETIGPLVNYRYDAQGLLQQVILQGGRIEREFAYLDGLMVYQKLATGLECRYQWERWDCASGPEGTPRVLQHSSSDGQHYRFVYSQDSSGKQSGGHTQVTDQLGRQYRWQWNQHFNPTSYTNPLG